MKYGSVCSGIEAATVAWHPLGWEPVWFAEIEKFPSKVLKHHYPHVPNLGDMTKLNDHEVYRNTDIDVLVGGTPCQSFSIAGLRGGLDDERGNLAFFFCRILINKHPTWFVWENVPGVFSSYSRKKSSKIHPRRIRHQRRKEENITETSDFAAILNAFQECGYSCAYRVFNSQYFGVPQRRRRVFVVGHLGTDWRPPAAVLFERESLRWDLAPSRKKGQEVAGALDARTSGGGFTGSDGAMNGQVVACLDANYGKLQGASGQDLNHGHSHLVAFGGNNTSGPIDTATALNACKTGSGRQDFESETFILQSTLYTIMPQNSGKDYKAKEASVTQPLMAGGPVGGNQGGDFLLQFGQMVRRLTPLECERLQGFPDNYTNILGASDSARYRAIGNSMTVQVMRWIGERIQSVNNLITAEEANKRLTQ